MVKREIDLQGPQGNAFNLMGLLSRDLKDLGKTKDEIEAIANEMTSGDYDHLCKVFERELGEYYELIY